MQHWQLRIKPKWRPVKLGRWCCFVRQGWAYVSLCGRWTRPLAGGATCSRPPAVLRCGRCDGLEMELAGKDESLPTLPGWRDIPPAPMAPKAVRPRRVRRKG